MLVLTSSNLHDEAEATGEQREHQPSPSEDWWSKNVAVVWHTTPAT